jgi:hypothetical protein
LKRKLLSPTELKQLHAQQEEQKKLLAAKLEQKKLEEEKANKKLVPPKQLLNPVVEEEVVQIKEEIEPPKPQKKPIQVLHERVEELAASIQKPKYYDAEIARIEELLESKVNQEDYDLTPLYIEIQELKGELLSLPEVRYYDEEISNLQNELNELEIKYYDDEISYLQERINSIIIPEVKYYDKDINDLHERIDLFKISNSNLVDKQEKELKDLKTFTENLADNLSQLVIPEEFDPSQLETHISSLQESLVDIRNEISNLPEVKYYENELNSLTEMITNVRDCIPVIPEIKYYDDELNGLLSTIEEVRQSIPELPEVRYYETEIAELEKQIQEVENKIPELPEIKSYDNDIVVLENNIVEIKKSLFELQKSFSEIKIPEIPEQVDWNEDIQKIYEEIKNLKEVPVVEESTDPLVPLDQKFATLDDLQNHYRIFINRIQQQLASLGGGGEVRLNRLDDVSFDNTVGSLLIYDGSKWTGISSSALGGGVSAAINANVAGIATYSNTSGVSTYASLSGIASNSTLLDNQLPSYYLDYNNFTNTPTNLSDFTNNVGFITSSALVGYATEAYVNLAIANLIDSSPATLDTLNELAQALGDDPNFSVTITNSIANKLSLDGGVVTGIITASGFVGDLTGTASNATYAVNSGIATYASTAGIATVAEGLTGTPDINVGLTTASRLIVGSGTLFTEDFVVEGNARVVGILTVGSSSITIDGSENQVNVGTGVTIHHTNGVQVGGNTVHFSGLTINQANVSGIVTASGFVGDLTGTASSATYAVTAGVASYAANTGVSTYSNVAGIATYATSSGIATYADVAGLSTYSSSAGIATYATTAGVSTNSTLLDNQLPSYYLDYTNFTNTPSNLSDFTNDVGFITSSALVGYATETYVNNLVAISTFSGDYNDLSNTPTIPSIVGLASEGYVNNLVAISTFSGDYNDLSNTPTIPSDTGDLTNSVGFITSSALVGYATETYVDVSVANLVNSAPETLDTLKELADALGSDPNFSVTITNSLANKLSLSGGVVSGIITASGFVGNLTGTATTATYAVNSGIATYASTSGIATVSQGLAGIPDINVGLTTVTRLIVGAGTTFPEDLVVEGNTRITGILTVGTSSIVIDGEENQVNVGSGVTLHHTNGVQVGGNTLHFSGLTLNQINVSGIVTASSFSLPDGLISSGSLTTSSPTEIAIDSFSASSYRSAKYQVQVESGSNYQTTEISVLHNDTTTFMTEYGTLQTGDSLASFTTDLSDGSVRLLATSLTAGEVKYKVLRNAIRV